MPAYRNILRRSRRLSNQEPRNYDEAEWESYKLLYPTPEPETTTPSEISSSPLTTSCSGSGLASVPSSSEVCRPSHSRRRRPGHIPRPPNAFMLFRSDLWKKQKSNPVERDHRHISRIAGHCWNELSDQERGEYKKLAEKRKRLHANEYPGYKYTPVLRKEKPVKRKVKRDGEGEEERCRKVALLLMEGMEGTDLEMAVKKMEEEEPQPITLSPCSNTISNTTPSTSRYHSSRTRAPQKQAVHPRRLKVETPQAVADRSPSLSDPEFVPTSQIPPLDLSALKKEGNTNNEFDRSLRPPSYDCIDSQFGFKAEVTLFVRDSFLPPMVCMEDGRIAQDEPSPMLTSSEPDDYPLHPIDDSIGFNTSFDFKQIEIGHGPIYFEQLFGNPVSPTTVVEPAPAHSQDFDMSSYIDLNEP